MVPAEGLKLHVPTKPGQVAAQFVGTPEFVDDPPPTTTKIANADSTFGLMVRPVPGRWHLRDFDIVEGPLECPIAELKNHLPAGHKDSVDQSPELIEPRPRDVV